MSFGSSEYNCKIPSDAKSLFGSTIVNDVPGLILFKPIISYLVSDSIGNSLGVLKINKSSSIFVDPITLFGPVQD